MIINEIPIVMIKCLLITIIIETGIAFILKINNKKDYINIILVNLMTNPVVVSVPIYINIKYGLFQRNIIVIVLEILTIFLEGIIYKKYFKYNKINPYLISLILNLSSYIIGDFIKYI